MLVEPDEAVLAVYKKHAASVDDKRFQVRGGDITELASKGGVPCRYVANATTWRFKSTAHPASKAVADAASGLLEDAKRRHNFAKAGKAYPVAVQTQAPLHKREVRHSFLFFFTGLSLKRRACTMFCASRPPCASRASPTPWTKSRRRN